MKRFSLIVLALVLLSLSACQARVHPTIIDCPNGPVLVLPAPQDTALIPAPQPNYPNTPY